MLSAVEEARLAGEGVLSGIPDADGIVGDLGGGSLELVDVRAGAASQRVQRSQKANLQGTGHSVRPFFAGEG